MSPCAPFLAVCRASILVETPGDVASCSSPSRGKRRVFERCKPVFIDQLQLSTHAETLSDALVPRCRRCYITAVTGSQAPPGGVLVATGAGASGYGSRSTPKASRP